MKVSKNKWHFKLYTFWRQSWDGPLGFIDLVTRRVSLATGRYRPKSLCTYFWSIVFLTTLAALALIVLNVVLLIFIALYYVVVIPHDAWRERHPKQKSEGKGPGLLRAFLAAKKAKICPLIELVD